MGNFQQHITCSTATGVAVGGVAYHFGFSPPTCLVAAGLCSFAGMLPDIDSDTSKSFQECIYLTAGIGCILTASRLRHFGIDPDLAMLGGAFIFLFIRFVVAMWIKKITTHRGMMHSIPMAILSGELVFFVVTGTVPERLVKATALTVGFLSHLILDEVYSIDSTGAALRFKKSFGTALKWTNPKKQGSVMLIYSLIALFGFVACNNPEVIEQLNGGVQVAAQTVPSNNTFSWWSKVLDKTQTEKQPLPDDIQRAAAEFLLEQGSTSPPAQPYSIAVAQPADSAFPLFSQPPVPESILPSAMQLDNDWHRHAPILPAPIIVP